MKITLILCFLTFTSIILKAQSTQDYIEENVDLAQELMRENEIPASIILAVAIHESAAGKSKIARHLNNHFGVKGKNSNTEINSAYRDYPSIDSSYNHFITVLHSRSYFNALFDKYDQYDYKNWARGIQRGGYASSRTWSAQVIALINKYQLYQYDERPDDYLEKIIPAAEVILKKPIRKSSKLKSSTTRKMYVIKKGDNLNGIAERNGTTAKALMKKNGLKSALLQPGQRIKL